MNFLTTARRVGYVVYSGQVGVVGWPTRSSCARTVVRGNTNGLHESTYTLRVCLEHQELALNRDTHKGI